MFSSQKRIFAGKSNLRSEPFCPYYTDTNGHMSLQRNSLSFDDQPCDTPRTRPSIRDGKHRV